MINSHLTDEQLSDLLAGDNSDVASVTHVKQCDRCRAEIESLGSSVQHFNGLGMLWAEQNAPRRIPVPLHGMGSWLRWSSWMIPAALALIFSSFLFLGHDRNSSDIARDAVSTDSDRNEASIAEDNRLMAEINRELSVNIAPQVPITELRGPSAAPYRQRTARVVN
jgi:hypothetical protein